MDWGNFFSVLIGFLSGGIVNFFFLKEKRKALRVQNDSIVIEQWKSLYEELREELRIVKSENEKLKEKVKQYQSEVHALQKEVALMKVK